jgi:hypothetical protein
MKKNSKNRMGELSRKMVEYNYLGGLCGKDKFSATPNIHPTQKSLIQFLLYIRD